MEFADLVKVLVGIGSISLLITAGAVYYSRRITESNKDYTKEQLDSIDQRTVTAITELKSAFTESTKNTREDYNHLVGHIDELIDRIYTRMENNTQELKEYVATEVSSLKAKDYDQDVKIEHTKDKLHGISEDLLKFKLEASEKYQQKGE